MIIAVTILILATAGLFCVFWHAAGQIGKAIGDALRDLGQR